MIFNTDTRFAEATERQGRRSSIAALAAVVLLVGGCATITTGANQSITVSTDPSGAQCTLDRAGLSLAIVNPTPGTVQVDKSKNAIAVTCRKEGFHPSVGTLSSEFQGMTFGNIIFGGIIGVAVDAGSGALNQYPNQITIQLIPESFVSDAARDQFFDAAVLRARQRHAAAISQITNQCAADDGCASQVKALQAAGDAEIATLEQQRITSIVRP